MKITPPSRPLQKREVTDQLTSPKITDLLSARKAELASLLAAHEAMWKEKSAELRKLQEQHQAIQTEMQKLGAQNQLKVTHLEGMIAAYEAQLPKSDLSKSDKNKKK